MKKCLLCDNKIEKLNQYLCKDCYKKLKEEKAKIILLNLDNFSLKQEYYRWKRNLILTKEKNYKDEYQLKIIAIAEIINEKYNDNKFINQIIDYSNNQVEPNNKIILINEQKLQDQLDEESRDNDIDTILYSKRIVCKDGHRAASVCEVEIDNLLTDLKICHYYDMQITPNTNFRYDWYLPEYDLYIEYFGVNTKKYLEEKPIKKDFYKQNKLKLLSLEYEDLKNIQNTLKKKIIKASK